MRTRNLRLVALAAALGLVACAGGEDQMQQQAEGEMDEAPSMQGEMSTSAEQQAYMLPENHHESCEDARDRRGITPPIQRIRVEAGEIVADPEWIVQPPGTGIFGWKAPRRWDWEVEFKGDTLPGVPRTISGDPSGRPVTLVVPGTAPCREYSWTIRMWQKNGDSIEVDPGGVVEPWGGG